MRWHGHTEISEAQEELNENGINLKRISSVCKYSSCYRVIVWLLPCGLTDRWMCMRASERELFHSFQSAYNGGSCWHYSSKPVCEEQTQWASSSAVTHTHTQDTIQYNLRCVCAHTYTDEPKHVAKKMYIICLYTCKIVMLVLCKPVSDMTWHDTTQHHWHIADSSGGCSPDHWFLYLQSFTTPIRSI